MKYTGLFAGLVVAAGVLLGQQGTVIQASWCMWSLVLAVVFWRAGRLLQSATPAGLAPIFFFTAGLLCLSAASSINTIASQRAVPVFGQNEIALPRGQRVNVVGRVRSFTTSASGRSDCVIDVSFVRGIVATHKSRLRVLITFWNDSDDPSRPVLFAAHPGDTIQISGLVRPLPLRRNPYSFDTARYYRLNGIGALFEPISGTALVRDHDHNGLAYQAERIRLAVRHRILSVHHSRGATEILPALLFGDKSLLRTDTRIFFRSSGLAHLIAISGLHVGIIGAVLFWMTGLLASRLPVPFRIALACQSSVAFSLLVCFAILSGGNPSVSRAVVMAGVLLLGRVMGRSANSWNTLGVAVLLVLAFWPEDFFGAGFQLSFSALTGIFLVTGSSILRARWVNALPVLAAKIYSLGVISFAVSCSTLPVMLHHFHAAPLGGLISNVAAIPLTALVLCSAMLSCSFGALPVLGPLFASSTDLFATALLETARSSSVLLGGFRIDSSMLTSFFLGFVPLLLLWSLFVRHARWKVAAVLGAIAMFVLDLGSSAASLRVDFLDVGQGDAIVMRTPLNKTVLIDTGSGRSSATVIEDHLSALGIGRIDLLVLSHFHQDHIGGIADAAWRLPVSVIAFAGGSQNKWRALRQKLESRLGEFQELSLHRGDTIWVDESVLLSVLHPAHNAPANEDENDFSVVIRILYGNTALLLTGDVDKGVEYSLVRSFGDWIVSNVVKVAHHGSGTSSSLPFVRRTAADSAFAVISVGSGNRFNHPDDNVVSRWKKNRATVLTTSAAGAVLLRSDGKRFWRETWRKGSR